MASYAECMKKLNLSNEEFAKIEESAMRFQEEYGMDANEAFLSAIDSEKKALQSGRAKYIENILKGVTPETAREGLGAEAIPPIQPVEQVTTKKKKATKKKAKKKPLKKKVASKKAREPLFTKAPDQGVQDSIKGKMEAARFDQAVSEKTFTEENLQELKELMVEQPVEEPTAEFWAKNKEAGKRAVDTIKGVEYSVTGNKDKGYTFQIKVPEAEYQVQDFDAPAAQVATQVSKVFDFGRGVQDRRIEFIDTNKKKRPIPKANATEVVKLGEMLSGNTIDWTKNLAQQVRNNLMEGIAYLADKGYELTTIKDGELGISEDTVIFGTDITLSNLDQVSADIESLSQEMHRYERMGGKLYSPENIELLNRYNELGRNLESYGIGYIDAQAVVEETPWKSPKQAARELEKLGGRKRAIIEREDITEVVEEADQFDTNAFSSLEPEYIATGKKKPKPTQQQIKRYGKTTEIAEVSYIEKLLNHLGLQTKVIFLDDTGVFSLIKDIVKKESKARAGLKKARIEVQSLDIDVADRKLDSNDPLVSAEGRAAMAKINALESKIQLERTKLQDFKFIREGLTTLVSDQPKGRIIYNDEAVLPENRVPIIYINEKMTKLDQRFFTITHELGHLVQRVALDQAPKKVQKMIRDAAGEMTEPAFKEWFADQLSYWAMKREYPKTLIGKFFKDLIKKLKEVYKFWTNLRGNTLNKTFAEFIDAMVYVANPLEGSQKPMKTALGRKFEAAISSAPARGNYMPARSGMQQYADFTPMTPALSNLLQGSKIKAKKAFDKFDATKVGRVTRAGVEQVGESFLAFHDAIIRSADAKLRAMKNPTATWIADQWHKRSGMARKSGARPIPTEIHQRSARFHNEIMRISKKVMPRKENKVVDTIFGMEAGRLDKSSQVYKEIGNILISETLPDINKLEAKYGKEIASDIIDGHTAVREYLDELYTYLTDTLGLPVKRRKNYFPHALDVNNVIEDKAEFIRVLKEEGIGKDNKQGLTQDEVLEEFYQAVVSSDGTIMDLAIDNEGDVLGPSFQGLKSRVFSPQLAAKLEKFYINDTMSVLTAYTHSAIKRGVIQKRFNPDNKMRRDKRTGMEKFDPLFEMNERLDQAAKDYAAGVEGGMSPEQIANTRKIIEAYMGRLGANMNPKLRNMSALMVTYQNMRLLSFVVLSSIVDAGLIDSRSGAPFTAFKEAVNLIANKKSREELYEAAAMIGAIRDDITEHVVNDQQSMTYMSHKMKGMNESFFRLVRMHQWTNLSRVMSLSAGKNFMIKHANRPNNKTSQKYLKELGVTAEEVLAWGGDTTKMSDNINSALHQFIDESVIRPSAAIRPDWASDPHWAIFFHLKQFMWGYHETILRRVWEQTKDAEGLQKAVPIMLLAMATLPLAAAGYELRRFLGGAPEYTDKEGGDYFWELVQRSGAPGIMQLYVDADEAEEFGQFAPIALMGPTASQFLGDFLNKDFDVALARSIPFVAQMPALRNYITSD